VVLLSKHQENYVVISAFLILPFAKALTCAFSGVLKAQINSD
jgi:hypothetical protein